MGDELEDYGDPGEWARWLHWLDRVDAARRLEDDIFTAMTERIARDIDDALVRWHTPTGAEGR